MGTFHIQLFFILGGGETRAVESFSCNKHGHKSIIIVQHYNLEVLTNFLPFEYNSDCSYSSRDIIKHFVIFFLCIVCLNGFPVCSMHNQCLSL